jgi:hypothetical protein
LNISEDDLLRVLESLNEAQVLLRILLGDRKVNNVAVDMEFLDTKLSDIDFGKGQNGRVRYICNYELVNGQRVPIRVITVRDLVALSEAEVLRTPNVGRETLKRIKGVLSLHGLYFGMTL